MKPVLYVILAITVIALIYLFITVLRNGSPKTKSFQKELKARKPQKIEKTREEKKAEKDELKKDMAEKRALWKAEDKKLDEEAQANLVIYKQKRQEYEPIIEEKKALYLATKKEYEGKLKAAGLDANAEISEEHPLFSEKETFQIIEEDYANANRDYERLIQKVRIEKDRLSFIRKVDRWSKRGGRLRREIFLKRQYYYLVAPYTILFLIFTVAPVIMSLYFSFTYFNLLESPSWIGWENYMQLFVNDKVFIIALRNTAILAVITGPISYLMAFLFAWLINELKPLLRSIMTLIFYAPSISGNAYLVWKLIFSSDMYGYANSFLMRFNFINEPITWLTDSKYIIWILIIVQLWLSLGVSFLAFIAGLQSANRELYEAGAIDGIKNRWQELWYITLPQMKSQLLFSAVMQITSSLAIAEVSIQIAGFPSIDYAGHTIITHLMDYGNLRMEMGYASAIATILFLIMIGANLLIRKLLRRVGS